MEWSRAQKRAYSRIRIGLKRHKGEILRFLTLTSAPNMKRDVSNAFRALKERIRRKTAYKLFKEGYLKKGDLRKYNSLLEPLKFEYIKIETWEGVEGVYHVLYFGDYLPWGWLTEVWEELTGTAKVVWIRATRKGVSNEKKLASYCVSQYVAGQNKYVRFSCSSGWAFRGFISLMRFFIKELGFERGIKALNTLIETCRIRVYGEWFILEGNLLIRRRYEDGNLFEFCS